MNTINMYESNIIHTAQSSAVYISQTDVLMQEVAVSSSTVDGVNNHMVYADLGSMVYLVDQLTRQLGLVTY